MGERVKPIKSFIRNQDQITSWKTGLLVWQSALKARTFSITTSFDPDPGFLVELKKSRIMILIRIFFPRDPDPQFHVEIYRCYGISIQYAK